MASQNENKARSLFKQESQGTIHLELIENILSEATADAMCINRSGTAFWIEFKHLEEWPKRPTTLPLRTSFKKGQIPFLKQWQSWRGLAFVVLKAEGDWYLLAAKGVVGLDKDLNDLNTEEVKRFSLSTGLANIIAYLGVLH